MLTVYEKDKDGNILSSTDICGSHIVSITQYADSDEIVVRFVDGRVYKFPAEYIEKIEEDIAASGGGGGGGSGGDVVRPTTLNETIDLLMDNLVGEGLEGEEAVEAGAPVGQE